MISQVSGYWAPGCFCKGYTFPSKKIRGHLQKWVSCDVWCYHSRVTHVHSCWLTASNVTSMLHIFCLASQRFAFTYVKMCQFGCGIPVIINALSGSINICLLWNISAIPAMLSWDAMNCNYKQCNNLAELYMLPNRNQLRNYMHHFQGMHKKNRVFLICS